jgi:hypothetical protein
MKIESIIKRDPPTEIDLDGTVYKFKPDEHGRHVAEVTDKHHIARLLAISEGYQLADDEPLPKAVQAELEREVEERTNPMSQPVLTPDDSQALKGSTVHPAVIDLGDGEKIELDDVIDAAYETSGLTTEEWNALTDEERHAKIDETLDAMAGGEEDDAGGDDANGDQPPAVTEQPSGQQQTDSTTPTDPAPATGKPADDQSDEDKAKAEREALANEYKTKFGVKPHYKWTIDKIREELAKPKE